MKEAGVDIAGQKPKSVEQFTGRSFDFVVTVCDDARETCPVFSGKVGKRLHLGFDDPSNVLGTEKEILEAFRKTRDEIRAAFRSFYERELQPDRASSISPPEED
jgi:arsenate reductase